MKTFNPSDPLTRSLTYVVDIWEAVERRREEGRLPLRGTALRPSGLSRESSFTSQAKPAAAIAETGADD
jgi:hypothetical protein